MSRRGSLTRLYDRWAWLGNVINAVHFAVYSGAVWWFWLIDTGWVSASPTWVEASTTVMGAFEGKMWFCYMLMFGIPKLVLKNARLAKRRKP